MRCRKARRAAAHNAVDPSRVDQVGGQIGANAIADEKSRTRATHRHPHGIGTMPISAIILGKRQRRDLGDIDALAADVAAIGMLHPIVVRPDGTLIAGERRIEAAKALGWSEVPVNIVDLDAVVRGEFAENSLRKDFTLSEAVAIKRALEPLERAGAKERQGERTDKHRRNFPQVRTGARSTRSPTSSVSTAPQSPRPRRSSRLGRPPRSAASRRRCRTGDCIASRSSTFLGPMSLTTPSQRIAALGLSRPCHSQSCAAWPSARSCTRIPFFGFGRRTFICVTPSPC